MLGSNEENFYKHYDYYITLLSCYVAYKGYEARSYDRDAIIDILLVEAVEFRKTSEYKSFGYKIELGRKYQRKDVHNQEIKLHKAEVYRIPNSNNDDGDNVVEIKPSKKLVEECIEAAQKFIDAQECLPGILGSMRKRMPNSYVEQSITQSENTEEKLAYESRHASTTNLHEGGLLLDEKGSKKQKVMKSQECHYDPEQKCVSLNYIPKELTDLLNNLRNHTLYSNPKSKTGKLLKSICDTQKVGNLRVAFSKNISLELINIIFNNVETNIIPKDQEQCAVLFFYFQNEEYSKKIQFNFANRPYSCIIKRSFFILVNDKKQAEALLCENLQAMVEQLGITVNQEMELDIAVDPKSKNGIFLVAEVEIKSKSPLSMASKISIPKYISQTEVTYLKAELERYQALINHTKVISIQFCYKINGNEVVEKALWFRFHTSVKAKELKGIFNPENFIQVKEYKTFYCYRYTDHPKLEEIFISQNPEITNNNAVIQSPDNNYSKVVDIKLNKDTDIKDPLLIEKFANDIDEVQTYLTAYSNKLIYYQIIGFSLYLADNNDKQLRVSFTDQAKADIFLQLLKNSSFKKCSDQLHELYCDYTGELDILCIFSTLKLVKSNYAECGKK